MVIKGGSRRNIGFWSAHLQDTKKNDRAELVEKRGVAAEDLRGMMREMLENSELTRCKNFMYIASFNPREGEVLTEAQWDRAYEIFEQERGIPEGQPRIVYEHEKHGRIHRHVVWDRVDQEKQRAFPDSLDLIPCEAAKHKIEAELALQKTPGLLNRDPELPPAERRPKSWEMFRGMKSGVSPQDVKAEVTAIFRESEGPADFAAGLEAHGYRLCIGDRRGFVILDSVGDVHSLAKRLDGVNTKQLNAFMEGYDRATLPSVDQAKARYQERKLSTLEADSATVAQEIEREEAYHRAAIEKEKAEPARGTLAGGQPAKAPDPEKPEGLQGTAAKIWEAIHASDNAPSFVSALAERGLEFSRVHEDDRRPQKEAEDAREELAHLTSMKANGLWSMQTDGWDRLSEKQLDRADESYTKLIAQDKYQVDPENSQPSFESYVESVQKKNAERMEQLKEKAALLDFTDGGLQPWQRGPRPVAKTGAYVVIDEWGNLHQINQRTTGLYPAEVQKFLAPMDAKPVQSVTAAREIVAERQQERRDAIAAGRLERAANTQSNHRAAGKKRDPTGAVVDRGIRQGLSIIGGTLNFAAKALESLFAPPQPKTRAVMEEEHRLNENAAAQSERAEGNAVYDAEHDSATARQQEQARLQQIAAEQYERQQRDRDGGRGRER
jgi:Relaxase/Mobilisation nuclease domain